MDPLLQKLGIWLCGCPGTTTFLLKKCLHPPLLKIPGSASVSTLTWTQETWMVSNYLCGSYDLDRQWPDNRGLETTVKEKLVIIIYFSFFWLMPLPELLKIFGCWREKGGVWGWSAPRARSWKELQLSNLVHMIWPTFVLLFFFFSFTPYLFFSLSCLFFFFWFLRPGCYSYQSIPLVSEWDIKEEMKYYIQDVKI